MVGASQSTFFSGFSFFCHFRLVVIHFFGIKIKWHPLKITIELIFFHTLGYKVHSLATWLSHRLHGLGVVFWFYAVELLVNGCIQVARGRTCGTISDLHGFEYGDFEAGFRQMISCGDTRDAATYDHYINPKISIQTRKSGCLGIFTPNGFVGKFLHGIFFPEREAKTKPRSVKGRL